MFAAALDVERGIYYRRSYLAPPISTARRLQSGAAHLSVCVCVCTISRLFSSAEDGNCQIVVEQRWYAHRVYWFLFNMEIEGVSIIFMVMRIIMMLTQER